VKAVHRLDEVCEVVMGQAPSGEAYNTDGKGWPLIAGAGDFGETKPEAKKFTTEASKLSRDGDIVLGIRASIGEKVLADGVYCLGRGVAALRARTSLESRFLWHWLAYSAPRLAAKAKGATFKQVNREDIGELEIELPPLAEQRRIAEVLDRAEGLRAKRRAALAQLESLTQSLFLDLFGDPVLNSKGWKCVAMTDAVIGKYGIKAGPFGSSLKKEDYAVSGYRIYGQEQVIAGRFDIGDYYIGERKYQQLKSCAVAEGDLLVSLVGSFGKVLIVPAGIEPGIINPRLLKITPNQASVTPDFLASLLQHPTVQAEFQRVAHGGTMGILNAGLLKQLKVILPPISLQREFARRVTAVEALKTAHRASLAELNALFATLQHRAFRGEL
jgi:type I restriction enzyme, S subunit